jgi:hypothetical protein
MLPGRGGLFAACRDPHLFGVDLSPKQRELLVLEDDSAALVVLWDCRFRVGCEKPDPVSGNDGSSRTLLKACPGTGSLASSSLQ